MPLPLTSCFASLAVLLPLLGFGVALSAPVPVPTRVFVHPSAVRAVAFNPLNTSEFLSAGEDSLVRLWNKDTGGTPVRTYNTGPNKKLYSVTFNPVDATEFLVSGRDTVSPQEGAIARWNKSTGVMSLTYSLPKPAAPVFYLPSGNQFISGCEDSSLYLFNRGAAASILRYKNATMSRVMDAALDPFNATAFASAGEEQFVWLWDTRNPAPVKCLPGHPPRSLSAAYDPFNPYQLLAGGIDNITKLWRTDTGALVRTFVGHTGGVRVIRHHPTNPNLFLTGSMDFTIRLWDKSTGQTLAIFTNHTAAVFGLAFNPNNGTEFLSAAFDGTVVLWSIPPSVVPPSPPPNAANGTDTTPPSPNGSKGFPVLWIVIIAVAVALALAACAGCAALRFLGKGASTGGGMLRRKANTDQALADAVERTRAEDRELADYEQGSAAVDEDEEDFENEEEATHGTHETEE